MNDPDDLREINKRLRKKGLRVENVQNGEWLVLYRLVSEEVEDGVSIREWERLREIHYDEEKNEKEYLTSEKLRAYQREYDRNKSKKERESK